MAEYRWLIYFEATQVGEVSKLEPIDELSMPLGMVLAAPILG